MVPQNEVVYLCPGEQISITCSTNNTFLGWDIELNFSQYGYYIRRYVSMYDSMSYYSSLLIRDTIVNFTKNSERGALPLISTLIINNASANLNGTVINCTGLGVYTERISVTVIHVINGKIISE